MDSRNWSPRNIILRGMVSRLDMKREKADLNSDSTRRLWDTEQFLGSSNPRTSPDMIGTNVIERCHLHPHLEMRRKNTM